MLTEAHSHCDQHKPGWWIIMSELKHILTEAKESLAHIEKQAYTLGIALKNAAPNDSLDNPSVQYLLATAHELEYIRNEYEKKLEELILHSQQKK